ncbi:MAG: phosphoenolpyruvate phosphomutase [Chloroflexi bacterium]|nr:MAG: phosphoenolpyruvate phosphomutase [Chloroflexota bacterium]
MTKAARLRKLLSSDRLIRVAGAHNGLSAKLVETAKFEAIWASGLEISASYGLPDTHVVTMIEFLEAAAQMDFVTTIPIIADCNTGYGDEYNVMHLIKHYERIRIAGVCIEDKVFPKINSFMHGPQILETIEKFSSKIRAAKAAQENPDFVLIARTEAFIAGLGLEAALARAYAYAEAGADLILVHSKASTAEEIAQFMQHWSGVVPIAVVPTTYGATTTQQLYDLGIKVVIYANQGMRAAVRAMQTVFSTIVLSGHTSEIESTIASVREIFALQGIEG